MIFRFHPDYPDATDEQKWEQIRLIRSVVTGALEIERAQKRIGSSLEAAPIVYLNDPKLSAALADCDFAEICIVSNITLENGAGPSEAFRLPDVPRVSVSPQRAKGVKCARSWKYFDPALAEPDYQDVTSRDAQALRELKALGRWSAQA